MVLPEATSIVKVEKEDKGSGSLVGLFMRPRRVKKEDKGGRRKEEGKGTDFQGIRWQPIDPVPKGCYHRWSFLRKPFKKKKKKRKRKSRSKPILFEGKERKGKSRDTEFGVLKEIQVLMEGFQRDCCLEAS